MAEIAVIGCGVIGLSAALILQEHLGSKVKVTIFTDKLSPYTTGDVSAGLWSPYLLQDTPEEKIIKWAKCTQDYLLNLWKSGEAKNAGISLQAVTKLSSDKNFHLPEWLSKISLGYKPLSQEQINHYNKKSTEAFNGGYSYVCFTWEPSIFLPYLQQKFLQNGGKIKIRRIEKFQALSEFEVIVNCTGLYSKYLVPDDSVQPMRGQVARVESPWIFHSLLTDTKYIIANIQCVILGGTQQVDDFSVEVNDVDKRVILEACFKFVPSLVTVQAFKHSVGLRPGRNTVRLELETRRIEGKLLKIVHNYGHGGSGVTLSIGCALDVAELVKEALESARQSKL